MKYLVTISFNADATSPQEARALVENALQQGHDAIDSYNTSDEEAEAEQVRDIEIYLSAEVTMVMKL